MTRARRGGARHARPRIETSAGGVVYRPGDPSPQVLLIRDRYGHWGFPKGHLEEGETPSQAALREIREETGLTDLVLGPELRTIDWFFRFRGRLIHKYCHFFLVASPTGDPVPQREEGITECAWLPLDEAVTGISYDNARDVLRAAVDLLRSAPPV